MKEYKLTDWLPTTKKEVEMRGWKELDVILFSGDAYVDHPSFGPAVIGRLLEAQGLKVAIVPQPNWRDDLRDFKKLGHASRIPQHRLYTDLKKNLSRCTCHFGRYRGIFASCQSLRLLARLSA